MDEVEVVLAEDVAVVEEAQVLLLDHPLDRGRHPEKYVLLLSKVPELDLQKAAWPVHQWNRKQFTKPTV